MSRKSRLTLSKERLTEMSDCPLDIFDAIEPEEELFELIERADGGDADAVRELTELTCEAYLYDEEPSESLLHYAKKGVSLGDEKCALIMLKAICRFNVCFDRLDEVLSVLDGKDVGEPIEDFCAASKVKEIIAAASHGSDLSTLAKKLNEADNEYAAYARIYLASLMLASKNERDSEELKQNAEALGMPNILSLPILGGKRSEDARRADDPEGECEAISYAMTLIIMDEWQNFWLRAAYEYASLYLDGDLSLLAEDMSEAIMYRCDYPKKKLHLLAFEKYMLDDSNGENHEDYRTLLEACRFDGLDHDVEDTKERDRLILEAVYTDGKELRLEKQMRERLGTEIKHTKNRYVLSATTDNHQKRGSKHIWEVTLSLETDSDTEPKFGIASIVERNNFVSRGGVTLEKEKKVAQVLCQGDIKVNEKICPLEIDLIVDISYVSSTKCEHCEIKIKDTHREGEYLVMRCSIALY